MGKTTKIVRLLQEKERMRAEVNDNIRACENEIRSLETRLNELDILYAREKGALESAPAPAPKAPPPAKTGDLDDMRARMEALRIENEVLRGILAAPPENRKEPSAPSGAHQEEIGALKGTLAEKEKVLAELKGREREIETEFLTVIEDLARGFSHRIRNYLGTISGTVQLLVAQHTFEAEVKEQLKIVDDNVAEMLSATEEFLKITKVRESLNEMVNVHQVLDGILASLKPVLDTQNIQLNRAFGEGIPAYNGTAKYLEEAFRNVLQNSLESMPQGGRLDVSTFYDRKSGDLSVKITDTGIGIAEQHLKKVFQPYFTSKKQHRGNGLTVARQIVDMHGGKLILESAKGKGTTITIHFFP